MTPGESADSLRQRTDEEARGWLARHSHRSAGDSREDSRGRLELIRHRTIPRRSAPMGMARWVSGRFVGGAEESRQGVAVGSAHRAPNRRFPMTVGELVKSLSKLDPSIEVLCYTEDEDLLAGRVGFLLLDVTSVAPTDGEPTRVDGRPYLKLGKGPYSKTHALLDVTADF